jgi:hypothetical protein
VIAAEPRKDEGADIVCRVFAFFVNMVVSGAAQDIVYSWQIVRGFFIYKPASREIRDRQHSLAFERGTCIAGLFSLRYPAFRRYQ